MLGGTTLESSVASPTDVDVWFCNGIPIIASKPAAEQTKKTFARLSRFIPRIPLRSTVPPLDLASAS